MTSESQFQSLVFYQKVDLGHFPTQETFWSRPPAFPSHLLLEQSGKPQNDCAKEMYQ